MLEEKQRRFKGPLFVILLELNKQAVLASAAATAGLEPEAESRFYTGDSESGETNQLLLLQATEQGTVMSDH